MNPGNSQVTNNQGHSCNSGRRKAEEIKSWQSRLHYCMLPLAGLPRMMLHCRELTLRADMCSRCLGGFTGSLIVRSSALVITGSNAFWLRSTQGAAAAACALHLASAAAGHGPGQHGLSDRPKKCGGRSGISMLLAEQVRCPQKLGAACRQPLQSCLGTETNLSCLFSTEVSLQSLMHEIRAASVAQ